jgi:drug/metabolite transporter (DMT)-like permease
MMRPSDIGRLLLLALIWGASFVFIKLGLRGFSPLEMVGVRLLFGAAVLGAVLAFSRQALPRSGDTWRALAFMAVVSNCIPFWLIAWGEERVAASLASILNSTTPLFTALIAALVLPEERLHPLRVAGIGLGFVGVVVVVGLDSGGGIVGGLAVVLAALAYGIAFVYASRRLPRSAGSPLGLAAGQMLAAALIVLPFAALQSVLRPPSVGWLPALNVVALGVLGTGLAYVLYYRLINDLGPTTASFVVYLVPLFGVLGGYLVLGEQIGVNTAAGGALVIGGISLAERGKRKSSEQAEAGGAATASRGATREGSGSEPSPCGERPA